MNIKDLQSTFYFKLLLTLRTKTLGDFFSDLELKI